MFGSLVANKEENILRTLCGTVVLPLKYFFKAENVLKVCGFFLQNKMNVSFENEWF